MNALSDGQLPPQEETGETRAPWQLSDLQKTITMAQIAKAAGVSQGAISSLLNDRDYGIRVSEKTRERVFKICREMGYIPNDFRAVVRMYPELGDFCFLLSSKIAGGLRDPFAHRLSYSAMAAVPDTAHPLSFALYDETEDYSSPGSLPHPIRVGTFSKFLLHGPSNTPLIEAITRRGLPVLSLGYAAPLPGVTSLVPDYAHAAELAIEHLVQLGHRAIGIIAGPFGSTEPKILEMNRGISLAFERLGLSFDAQNIIHGDLSAQAGRSALEQLLQHRPAPTALFAMSDSAALASVAFAQARGISVPGQLSVVGCGDDLCADTAYPSLTTVHLPAEEMAELGIREIDRLIRDGMPDSPRQTLLPVQLMARASSAQLGAEKS
jgi:DNA-binding LacI/PurR family transcriptional regulator